MKLMMHSNRVEVAMLKPMPVSGLGHSRRDFELFRIFNLYKSTLRIVEHAVLKRIGLRTWAGPFL
jgi:hypothetical protein